MEKHGTKEDEIKKRIMSSTIEVIDHQIAQLEAMSDALQRQLESIANIARDVSLNLSFVRLNHPDIAPNVVPIPAAEQSHSVPILTDEPSMWLYFNLFFTVFFIILFYKVYLQYVFRSMFRTFEWPTQTNDSNLHHTNWEDEWFVVDSTQKLDDWICSICFHVMQNPVQTVPCGHNFCETCILKWIGKISERRCPLDETMISVNELFPDARVKRQISNLKIRCRVRPEACPFRGTVGDGSSWTKHESGDCKFCPAPQNLQKENSV